MKRIRFLLLMLGVALPLAGCVVEPPGYYPAGGWCYWHPYRCR
ncbi:MAG TPA: hypothetical protein VGC09_03715 [Rhodopila sp.]